MEKKEFNPDLCENKHKNIDKELELMWGRIKSLDKRVWAILILEITIIMGLAKVLIK